VNLFSPRHLLIILLIVLVVFGTRKLRSIGADLGSALRSVKNAFNEDRDEVSPARLPVPAEKKTESIAAVMKESAARGSDNPS
jgi:sec-independent protein translocase protein TatA